MGELSEKAKEYRNQIKPCNEGENFVFISYSSDNAEIVYKCVIELQKRGINIWIDKELEQKIGDEWNEVVFNKLQKPRCKCILFFMSESSMTSIPVCIEHELSRSDMVCERHKTNKLPIYPIDIRSENKGLNDWVYDLDKYVGDEHEFDDNKKKSFYYLKDKINDYHGIEGIHDKFGVALRIYKKTFGGNQNKTYAPPTNYDAIILTLKQSEVISTNTAVPLVPEDMDLSALQNKLYTQLKDELTKFDLTMEMKLLKENETSRQYAILVKNSGKSSQIVYITLSLGGYCSVTLNDKLSKDIPLEKLCPILAGQINKVINDSATSKPAAPKVQEDSIAEQSNSQQLEKQETILPDANRITYSVYGVKYTGNQAEMMVNTFHQVLKRHEDKIAILPEQPYMNCVSVTDYTKIKKADRISYFRACQYLDDFSNGKAICVGTSYDMPTKLKKINQLLAICGESIDVFQMPK